MGRETQKFSFADQPSGTHLGYSGFDDKGNALYSWLPDVEKKLDETFDPRSYKQGVMKGEDGRYERCDFNEDEKATPSSVEVKLAEIEMKIRNSQYANGIRTSYGGYDVFSKKLFEITRDTQT